MTKVDLMLLANALASAAKTKWANPKRGIQDGGLQSGMTVKVSG